MIFTKRSLLLCIFTCLLTGKYSLSTKKKDKPVVVYKLRSSGLGSNLMLMLTHKVYYEDHGYTFKVAEHDIRYKYKGKGILSSFFSPNFKVIDDEKTFENHMKSPKVELDTGISKRVMMKGLHPQKGRPGYDFYSLEACKFLKFNPKAKSRIELKKQKHKMPANYATSVSVGFHVRRGDKVGMESRKFEAKEYVDKLKSLNIKERVKYCFVATDDYAAVTEMKKELDAQNVRCIMRHIKTWEDKGNKEKEYLSDDDVLKLMTEVSMLVEATYFIGTYSSNFGILISLLRRCHHKDSQHYSNSYAIDSDFHIG